MNVLIITVAEPHLLLSLWKKVIGGCRAHRFSVLILDCPWEYKEKRVLPAIERSLVAFFLYALHYGVAGALKKVVSRFLGLFGLRVFDGTAAYMDFCRRQSIPCAVVKKTTAAAIEAHIRAVAPEIILYQAPWYLPEQLRVLASRGAISRHPSLLPQYKGCFPVFWAMLRGEREIGVSIHRLDRSYDSGEVLAQEVIIPRKNESLASVYRATFDVGAALFAGILDGTAGLPAGGAAVKTPSYFGWPRLGTVLAFLITPHDRRAHV